jgi:hypothetical protein
MAGRHLGWAQGCAKSWHACIASIGDQSKQRRDWRDALIQFEHAQRACEQHACFVYEPAAAAMQRELQAMTNGLSQKTVAKVRAMLWVKHGILKIEERGDALAMARARKLQAIFSIAAPSWAALASKLELMCGELTPEPVMKHALISAASDARRLAKCRWRCRLIHRC